MERTHAKRAVQAWQILVSAAMNRQTIRYEQLARHMYQRKTTGLILAQILGRISRLCRANGLPALNVLVVNEQGLPGHGYPATSEQTADQEREAVYKIDWYNIVPPMEADLPRWEEAAE